jgi:hypothetical protein
MAKASARPTPPAAPTVRTVQFEVAPSPDAREGLTLAQQATALRITDRATHADALEFARGLKQLKRKIEDHWSKITRSVDDLKRNLLTLKRADLDPVEQALEIVTQAEVAFRNERDRIERIEQDRIRREAEEKARQDAERRAQEAEAAAQAAEESSPTLSAREETFLGQFLSGISGDRAAQIAGYKDYKAAAARLLNSQKIVDAIRARKEAAAIREQAAAAARQPVPVTVPKVQTEKAKVVGVRSTTYYSARVDDFDKLIDGVIAGTVDRKALRADEVWLNGQARQLQESFEGAFPGCALVVKQGLAG